MNGGLPNGWVGVAADDQGLKVWHRVGETWWVDAVRRVRNGDLAGWQRVQSAGTSRVYRGQVDPAGGACFLKEYLDRDWLDPLKNLLRPSRARRALLNEEVCRSLGFHLPASRCLVEQTVRGRLVYCALVTDAVEQAPVLRDWLTRPQLGCAGHPAEFHRLLHALGRELGSWHAAGLHHGDLRLGNVLCRREGDAYRFFWLDNERNRKYRKLPLRLRVHNLMRINYEPVGVRGTDRLRAWHAYLETAGLSKDQERLLLRKVVDATMARRRRKGMI